MSRSRQITSVRPSTARSIQAADPTGQLRRASKMAGATLSYEYESSREYHQSSSSGFQSSSHQESRFSSGAQQQRSSPRQSRARTSVRRGVTLGKSEAEQLMTKAVASSKWEVKEDTVDEAPRPTQMHRVLVRKVEVPVKRKVKVPVKTKAVRRVNRNRRVKVKRLVEVPAFKEVEEEYTEVKYRRVKKPKEVWVKKIVEEVVEEPYEVKKTRTKRVPTTEFKEVEEWQDVVVEEDELVDKTGFRVDEVEDTKLVEVEEEEVYELVPRPVKTNVRGAVELGMSKRHHIARRLGSTARDAEEVVDVPLDDLPSDREVTRDLVAHLKHRLGMVVSERRSEKRGVRVKFVRAGYPADLAGLVPGDILTHVDGVPTHNLNEFRAAVGRSGETLVFTDLKGDRTSAIPVTKRPENVSTARVNMAQSLSLGRVASPRTPASRR